MAACEKSRLDGMKQICVYKGMVGITQDWMLDVIRDIVERGSTYGIFSIVESEQTFDVYLAIDAEDSNSLAHHLFAQAMFWAGRRNQAEHPISPTI